MLPKPTDEQRRATFATFIEAVEDGHTLKEACKLANVAWGSVSRWIANPDCLDAEGRTFAERYTHARLHSGEGYAMRAQEVAEHATPETVQVARLQADIYKWRAAMADPKGYGDRKHVEVSGSVGHLHLEALQAPKLGKVSATAKLAGGTIEGEGEPVDRPAITLDAPNSPETRS